jgi:glycogen debranching enzyme
MAIEVTVGPPQITINRGSTFVLSAPDGSIAAYTDEGFYCRDTRYVSKYEFYADGKHWVLQNSGAIAYYASRAYLVNPQIQTEYGEIEGSAMSLVFTRAVHDGIIEEIEIRNYGLKRVRFNFEIALRTDFADIFEVKSKQVIRKGHVTSAWSPEGRQLVSRYEHDGFIRSLVSQFVESSCAPIYNNGRISFGLDLEPRAVWRSVCKHTFVEDETASRGPERCLNFVSECQNAVENELNRWKDSTTSLTSANEDIYRLFKQSVEDMAALRLPNSGESANEFVPAAGVPWFVAVFGRDSLIVSLQNMIVNPDFARSALKVLGELQATGADDYRDAQPGKILHEIRVGELAARKKIPHTPYYGTADATALYLITLHEAWQWLGDDALFRQHEQNARRCLEWIDLYGDMDGDGLQEFQTRSPQGYENMGWKDAVDSNVAPDGSLFRGPKALCELQGYTYDAWLRMSKAFAYFGDDALAEALRKKAAALRAKFEELFWCEDIGTYACALDGDKRQVKTIVSNPGHLLWSGVVSPERAVRVVNRLMQPDMWSGWGIRTLSSDNPAYNPFSYQNGSVWPHDNGIIAMGCRRYGFLKEAAMIARDISEAASYFVFYRLPELYGGVRREPGSFPVQYLGANVPQAWAAGSVFHLLRAILGLEANAHTRTLYIDPVLPRWLPDVTLHHLRVANSNATIRFWREQEETRFEILSCDGELHVKLGAPSDESTQMPPRITEQRAS